MDEIIDSVDKLMVNSECGFTDPDKRQIFEKWQKAEIENPQPFALIRLLRGLYCRSNTKADVPLIGN